MMGVMIIIITIITDKCVTAFNSDKILLCSLIINDVETYLNLSDKGEGYFLDNKEDYIKISKYKELNINIAHEQNFSIFPRDIKEIRDYYKNEKANDAPIEQITEKISLWISKINERVFNALLGYSTSGIADGWITKSIGVDGIDINVETLAKQIRLADLIKDIKNEETGSAE